MVRSYQSIHTAFTLLHRSILVGVISRRSRALFLKPFYTEFYSYYQRWYHFYQYHRHLDSALPDIRCRLQPKGEPGASVNEVAYT